MDKFHKMAKRVFSCHF